MIRAMIVDDSTIVRQLIRVALTADGDIEIVDAASNGAAAIPLAREHQPDIIILDIEMPVMDGLTALPKLREAAPHAKIIMASTLTLRNAGISLKALELGATDCVAKPVVRNLEELEVFNRDLREKVRGLAPAQRKDVAVPRILPRRPLANGAAIQQVRALAIASSTGGPQALTSVFQGLRGELAHIPIYVTQHMPPNFTTILAENLSKTGNRPCGEGKEGIIVQGGHAYIAPGNFHMTAERRGGEVVLHINQDAQENFCRPSADPMFRSLSQIYGNGLLALVLTGMGSDGLEGAKVVAAAGGTVIAQDEATSIVWSMPRAVAEQGLCKAVLPLPEIATYLTKAVAYAHG